MSDFLNWLMRGSGDDTSAQNGAAGVPQQAPTGFFGSPVPASAPALPGNTEPQGIPPQNNPTVSTPSSVPPVTSLPSTPYGGLPTGLPNIEQMLQNVRNTPAPPVTPAQTAAQVPPQPAPRPVGAGNGLAPDMAANAPAATGAPTPLTPDAGPTAPSATPAGRSLLDRIMGSDDASTKDSSGLTEAQRHATGFDALAKLGFGIMAASMPQAPGQRAAAIAQLGNIPADMLKQRAAMIGQQAQSQNVQLRDQQLKQRQAGIDALKTPEFKAWAAQQPKSMQGVIQAAAAAGDIKTIAALQEKMMPKMSGNMIWDPASGSYVNTLTGQAGGVGGASGAPGGAGASGAAPQLTEEGYNPAALQGADPGIAASAKMVGEGKAKVPALTDRNGVGKAILDLATKYNPKLDGTTFQRRDAAEKSYAPQGVTGQQMISLNTFAQHTNELRQAADGLDNTNLPVWNSLKNTYGTMTGANPQTRFNQVRDMATRELDTLVSKNHATITETASIRQHLNDAQSPEQLDTVISQMGRLAKDKLQSSTKQYQNALGKSDEQTMGQQLQNPEGQKALEEIDANPIKNSPRAQQHAAIRQQFGLPANADVVHFEYRVGPNGQVQKKPKK